MTADRLSSLDMSFLCLERPSTPMHMGAVAVFAGEVEPDALLAELARRADRIPRLRRTVHDVWAPPGAATWVEDRDFDAAWHIRQRRLPAPGARSQLGADVAEIMAAPLDRTRPLWEIHHVTGLANGSFALVLKLHHALADGVGAVEVGAAMLDEFAALAPQAPPAIEAARGLVARHVGWALRRADPRALAGSTAGLARMAGRGLTVGGTLVDAVLRPRSGFPALPVSDEERDGRGFAMARIPLQDVRRVRKHHGGTANDVLLAAIAGGLRDWLAGLGPVRDGRPVRAMVPVSGRRQADGPGNQFAVYTLDLPVGEPCPRRRLREVRRQMDRNKAGEAPAGPGGIVALAELLPSAVHRVLTPLAGRHAGRLFDTIVTSVPMPRGSVHVAGAELRELFPVVPLAAGHPVGIALSTYRDTAYVGVHAARTAAPHVRRLADAIPGALADLDQAPWPADGDRDVRHRH